MTPELRALVLKVARAQLYFEDYVELVHGWVPRPHQVAMFRALQLLADHRLRSPEASDCGVCDGAEACSADHATNKLLVMMFPGAGKSDTMVEYNCWVIGRASLTNEIAQCGLVSFADEVAQLRSVAVRDTIDANPAFRLVFPDCLPDKNKGGGQGEWFLKRRDAGKKDPTFRAAGITRGGLFLPLSPTLFSCRADNRGTPAERPGSRLSCPSRPQTAVAPPHPRTTRARIARSHSSARPAQSPSS